MSVDLPLLVIEHSPNEPVARLGEWLVEAGATLDIRRGDLGHEIPASLDGFSGLIVMGGAMGASDDAAAPWLPAVRALLATAVQDRVPTLAVCLGAQLLAMATGGRVAPMEEPEIGAHLVAKRTTAASDPLFRSLAIAPDVVQWHFDEVTDLPSTATLLASSAVAPNQAFRVSTLAWGIQFHIETTPAIVEHWARADAAKLPDLDLDRVLERVEAIDDDLVEAWRPFADAFVAVTRDPATLAPRGGLPMAGVRVTVAEPISDPALIRAALAAEMQAARGTHSD